MCTRRGTREPPMRSMSSLKAELAGLQPPKTGLPSPWHGSASSTGLKVCPHPVHTHCKATQSPAAEGWEGEMSPPLPLSLAELSGDTAGSSSSHYSQS